jgi:DNA-binding NtrC family response regulator
MAATGRMVADSYAMREIQDYSARAARTNCTVLITGETGTGKELVAQFIHENSPRRQKPLVCVNCAAIPDSLLENELFGHNKGAFTGAQELRDGLLLSADGGTVFLDEIGDLSTVAQAKILRVLETKEFCRLGGTRHVHVDLRFIAATNQDLALMASQKAFRQDLLYRLDVAHVHLPPLRERKEDIPALVQGFGRQFSQQSSGRAPEFTEDFLQALLRYDWPGNIRELKNVIERLLLLEPPGRIGVEHLPVALRRFLEASPGVSDSERERVISTLFSTNWNKTKAAEMLNWSRMTLYRKIAKYRISDGALPRSTRQ